MKKIVFMVLWMLACQVEPDVPATPSSSGLRLTAAVNEVAASEVPTEARQGWQYFKGSISANTEFSNHLTDFDWAYSRIAGSDLSKTHIVVWLHGSGGGKASVNKPFAPSRGSIEVRNVDAETYDSNWREWWTYSKDGKAYASNRIAATLDFIAQRYPEIRENTYGLVLGGKSMGGTGAITQTMLLPERWRSKIAYSYNVVGIVMPRRVNEANPKQFSKYWPADDGRTEVWDDVDFVRRAVSDPTVRGIHYRGQFSSDDMFSRGPVGSTQLEFVNVIERNKIGGAFFWVKNGHNPTEKGVLNPHVERFETAEQDVTIDRAHPAITKSTGNFPLTQELRVEEANYPRGHYNLGVTWDWNGIIDTAERLVFPLKYHARADIGPGIPDQPTDITVSVTPRRTKNFDVGPGAIIAWSWNGGELSGTAVASGDTVTIENIPLHSGDGYRMLELTHEIR